MTERLSNAQCPNRRRFLRQVCGGTAAAAVAGRLLPSAPAAPPTPSEQPRRPTQPLPQIKLGPHSISRLVAGWNPIGGFSHSTRNLRLHMLEYFTVERVISFLQHCEEVGITAWQFDHTDKAIQAIRTLREQGTQMKFICLHAERKGHDAPIEQVIKDTAPIAIVHHGGVTDRLFREGKAQKVHDFVKKVHDHGVLAGVSAHNPDNIKRIADEGWENDLFMTCFYYVTRPREEQLQLLGKVTVGEPFFQSDPDDMTAVVRQVDKPCLVFKILAAGRLCWNPGSVQRAFRYAFSHIKPTDGVIVGMYPRFSDEPAMNAELTRRFGAVTT